MEFINEGSFQEYDYNQENEECEWKQITEYWRKQVAKQKFLHFEPRQKPKKRKGRNAKRPNKKQQRKKYRGQGR